MIYHWMNFFTSDPNLEPNTMTNVIRIAALTAVRFVVVWLIDALSLLLAAWLMPGFNLVDYDGTSRILIAISASLLLAIVNLLIRPAILLDRTTAGLDCPVCHRLLCQCHCPLDYGMAAAWLRRDDSGEHLWRHRACFLQRGADRHLRHQRGRFLLSESHRAARQGSTLRQRQRAWSWPDDVGDRRPELLASAQGAR